MDGRGFDDLTRRLAAGRSRRAVLKGLLGIGSAAVASTLHRGNSEAAWSTLVCLPGECGAYIQRLVPTAAVPFYVNRYGAVLPENGECPVCEPEAVEATCAGVECGPVLNSCCQEVACGGCSPSSNSCVETTCASNQCLDVPLVGQPCNDGNACTEGEVCDASGACVGGSPVVCPEPPNECYTSATCDPVTGCGDPVYRGDDAECAGGVCYQGACCQGDCCVPDCSTKSCGSDGCGGSCGTCSDGKTCAGDKECVDFCSDQEDCPCFGCGTAFQIGNVCTTGGETGSCPGAVPSECPKGSLCFTGDFCRPVC